MTGHISFEELRKESRKPWYGYGKRSPHILVARWRNKHSPVFRTRMAWQRLTRGYDDSQLWNLHHSLAKLTVVGVQNIRKWKNGYPSEFCEPGEVWFEGALGGGWDAWDEILRRIEEGFQAWLDEDGWFHEQPEKEAKFKEAMGLYAKWFGALWD